LAVTLWQIFTRPHAGPGEKSTIRLRGNMSSAAPATTAAQLRDLAALFKLDTGAVSVGWATASQIDNVVPLRRSA
jgi:hypothetical protein